MISLLYSIIGGGLGWRRYFFIMAVYMWLLILALSIQFWVEQNKETRYPTVVGTLYSATTKLLRQGCWPWVSLSKATIALMLMELCVDSIETAGKIWISGLFYLADKFGSLFQKLGQICLEWFLLTSATMVLELKDIRYTKEMENNFPK